MNSHRFTASLSAVFLPRTAVSAAPLACWIATAALSVCAASIVSLQPGHLADLWLVRDWLHYWSAAANPYGAFANLDYPPNALVVLWPLVWFDDATVVATLLPLSVAATGVGAWLLSGWLGEQVGATLTTRERLTLVAIMIAGSSLRGAIWRGQLSPLALLLGAAALHFSQRQPRLAALALGLCAFKPHVALGFALAILVTRGATIAIGGGSIALLLGVVSASLAGVDAATMWRGYLTNLLGLYGGEDRVLGMLSLRWVLEGFAGSDDLGTMIYAAAALITAAILIDAALNTTMRARRGKVAAGLLLWTLLFLPHQLYHGWMAAPALWLTMWPESGLIENARARLIAVAAFVSFGVIDIPRLARLLIDVEASDIGWYTYALSPLRLAILFGLLLWTISRRPAAPRPLPESSPA